MGKVGHGTQSGKLALLLFFVKRAVPGAAHDNPAIYLRGLFFHDDYTIIFPVISAHDHNYAFWLRDRVLGGNVDVQVPGQNRPGYHLRPQATRVPRSLFTDGTPREHSASPFGHRVLPVAAWGVFGPCALGASSAPMLRRSVHCSLWASPKAHRRCLWRFGVPSRLSRRAPRRG